MSSRAETVAAAKARIEARRAEQGLLTPDNKPASGPEKDAKTLPDTPPTIDAKDVPERDTAPPKRTRVAKPPATPPKSATSSARSAVDREIEAAMAVMRQTYDTIALGLAIYNPELAREWASKIDSLDATNRTSFEADATLRASIIRMGTVSTKGTFILAHLTALGPIGWAIAADIVTARKRKRETVTVPAEEAAFAAQRPTPANEGFWG